jgi:hypothetical protein
LQFGGQQTPNYGLDVSEPKIIKYFFIIIIFLLLIINYIIDKKLNYFIFNTFHNILDSIVLKIYLKYIQLNSYYIKCS